MVRWSILHLLSSVLQYLPFFELCLSSQLNELITGVIEVRSANTANKVADFEFCDTHTDVIIYVCITPSKCFYGRMKFKVHFLFRTFRAILSVLQRFSQLCFVLTCRLDGTLVLVYVLQSLFRTLVDTFCEYACLRHSRPYKVSWSIFKPITSRWDTSSPEPSLVVRCHPHKTLLLTVSNEEENKDDKKRA
uniref:Secreted protein n=1 Tax=Heterorhabditis bacteriophora TaxID=37862 RepID=A0A1I7X3D5_HETBA